MENLKITSFVIPEKLVQLAQKHYGDTTPSQAVLNAVSEFLILPQQEQNIDYSIIANQLNQEYSSVQRKVSLRIPTAVLAAIERLHKKHCMVLLQNTLSETVTLILGKICTTSYEPSKPEKLLSLMGSKWDTRMQNAIQHIFSTSGKRWNLSVETCAGALGIHANVNVADKRVLNDLDHDKINLYRCIQNNPRKLLNLSVGYEVNRHTFTTLKQNREHALKNAKGNSQPNYEDAARYLYLNINSYRNQLNTFADNASQSKYYQRLQQIMSLHKLLKDVSLLETDLLKVLKKYEHTAETLFIVDPPYLMSSGYQNSNFHKATDVEKQFGLESHKKLAKKLQKIVANGNDIIYFCRVTATRKKNKKNQIVMSAEEIEFADKTMQFYIDQLYKGHDFYYIDVELNNGITERIITSFPFKGGKQYK